MAPFSGGSEDKKFITLLRVIELNFKTFVPLAIILAILAGVYFILTLPRQSPKVTPKIYLWEIDPNSIFRVKVILPRQGKGKSFIKDRAGKWYFENKTRIPVDNNRWGGGIPLLLGGPSADRIVMEEVTEVQLKEYGLSKPRMSITIDYDKDRSITVIIGNPTPNNKAFYILAPGSNSVAIVDHSWYDVFARLVTDPPYKTTH